ncbi:MAG: hypothetical protein QXX95_03965 [Nitrososphaerales archaeon]
MKRINIFSIAFLTLFALGIILGFLGYYDTIYALDRANAWLNRAETAGFAEEMITYINKALPLIPKSGNPVWIFPTSRTDFELINRDLQDILNRAEIIKNLAKNSDAYQQGMDDLRDKLKTMQSQIGEAATFLYLSPLNIILGFAWLILIALTGLYWLRKSRKQEVQEEALKP